MWVYSASYYKFTFRPHRLAESPSCSRQAGPKNKLKKRNVWGERGGGAVLPMCLLRGRHSGPEGVQSVRCHGGFGQCVPFPDGLREERF